MAGKRYTTVTPNAEVVPFELELYRDDQPEVHQFRARPVTDIGSVMRMLRSGDDGGEKATAIMKMMSRMLVNTDGVPAQWTPQPLPRPKNAGNHWQPKFRGPDGNLYTLDKAAQFTDPAKGSSRRRWDYLMFEDDGVVVDIGVLAEIVQDMVAQAADRPTPALSPSTR